MQPPGRVTVPTCIGCGAMKRWGTCETSCSEHKLELVGAADFDGLEVDRSAARARTEAFRRVVEALAGTQPGPDGCQAAWQATQRAALAVLSSDEARDDFDEPAGHVTTWWCAECGDACRPATRTTRRPNGSPGRASVLPCPRHSPSDLGQNSSLSSRGTRRRGTAAE